MRYGVPLVRAAGKEGTPTHDAATEAAQKNLTTDDWDILEFYRMVADQYINQTPMGTKDGGVVLTPRMEAWVPACDVLGVPVAERQRVIWMARELFYAVSGKGRIPIETGDLAPPEFDDGC